MEGLGGPSPHMPSISTSCCYRCVSNNTHSQHLTFIINQRDCVVACLCHSDLSVVIVTVYTITSVTMDDSYDGTYQNSCDVCHSSCGGLILLETWDKKLVCR